MCRRVAFIDRPAAAVSAVLLALKPGRTALLWAGHWCSLATVSAQILFLIAQWFFFVFFSEEKPVFGKFIGKLSKGGVLFFFFGRNRRNRILACRRVH